jgi:hypothetical protein
MSFRRSESMRLSKYVIILNFTLLISYQTLKATLNKQTDIDLETQLDVYEEEANADFKELHDRFEKLNINTKYP